MESENRMILFGFFKDRVEVFIGEMFVSYREAERELRKRRVVSGKVEIMMRLRKEEVGYVDSIGYCYFCN